MRNFISPHVHVQSLDSASTPKLFAKRELELDTGYITVTDHGTLEATRAVYDMCAPGGKHHGKLTPILGLEGYFRDDNDKILLDKGIERKINKDGVATFVDHYKYSHITLHCLDEAAYYTLVKKLSDADFRAEQHGSERKPLFDWNVLEELGAQNITATSGCLIGMVGRHLMQNNDPDTAIKFYEKARSLFKPGNFFVELFPHVTDKFFQSIVKVKLEDGTVHEFRPKRKVRTLSPNDGGEVYAEDLAADFKKSPEKARKRHISIVDTMENRKWTGKQLLNVVSVEAYEGFVHNECKPWCAHGDYQLEVNRFIAALAKKHGDPILVSDDSHFAYPEEKILQDARLGHWRFVPSHHRMTSAEAFSYFNGRLGVSEATFEGWVQNSYDWASRFKDFKFSARNPLPTAFYPTDTLRHTFSLIQKNRRMNWNDPVMVARLKQEIDLLHGNGSIDLLSYFMVDEEVCDFYLRKGFLTGPGRGSAAGLLLTYLLGITHVNPIKYGLSVDRFMTLDRIQSKKLPDIDQDLPFRDLLVNESGGGFLAERFGANVAQMSVDIQLKVKNAIKDVHRIKDGFVSPKVNEICKALPDAPQGIESRDFVFGYEVDGTYNPGLIETSKVLQNYIAAHPEHWKVVSGLIGLPRDKGRHPCGFVISSSPIDSFIPMTTIGGVRVTSFTAASVEAHGGLKMDFLTVNSVGDIDRAVKLIQSRFAPELVPDGETVKFTQIGEQFVPNVRLFPLNGSLLDIWDLPEDKEVYIDIAKSKVETVFQLDGPAARQGLRQFKLLPDGTPPLKCLEDLSAFTALDRPGPLDAYVEGPSGARHNMLVEFAHRARGEEGIGRMPVLDKWAGATNGVIVYQEQLQQIFKEVGNSTGIEANNFRQRIGKKKIVDVRKIDKPLFMKGATESIGAVEAERLWGMMETFGQYGFNKSHAICYMAIAYACAFLKHYYPLEWWTSVLSNADRKDVDEKFWRYCGPLILMPDVTQSTSQFKIEGDKIRAPVWLIHGIGEKAHALLGDIVAAKPLESIDDLLVRLEDYKKANATASSRVDKKTGETVATSRLGHNPLNDSILRKMIVCDVMNSLFPAEKDGLPVDTIDRLSMFDIAAAKARGKKKVKPSATKFNLSNEGSRYQYIKSIMPAYTKPLIDMFQRLQPDLFRKNEDVVHFLGEGKVTALLTGGQFEWLENLEALPDTSMEIALPAYVLSQRTFNYGDDKEKTACELVLDIEGHRRQFVKWPSKKTGLPPIFKQDLEGAFVVGMFSRRSPTDSFFFDTIEVISPPAKPEESPND